MKLHILIDLQMQFSTGYVLPNDLKSCADIDECSGDNNCAHHCSNAVGSFSCYCDSGYQLIDGYKCLGKHF